MKDRIEACMKEWPESRFIALDRQLRQIEDEIIGVRREKYATAPSSFSYYLYEKKLEQIRNVWKQIDLKQGLEAKQELYLLAADRIRRLLEQDLITEEDFPEQENIKEMNRRHYELCMAWMECMLFMGPEPK